jgi:hypothetical protein
MAMLSIIQPNHRTAPPVRLNIIHETPTVTRPLSINVIANKLLGKCIFDQPSFVSKREYN